MKYFGLYITLAAVFVGCSSTPNRNANQATTPTSTTEYTYIVKHKYPHDVSSYTQGLYYDSATGKLIESVGEYGKSKLLRVDIDSGKGDALSTLPASEFGEGVAAMNGKVYQLTWLEGKAHIYADGSFAPLGTVDYAGEGWGITTDGERLFMSDGSEYISIVNPSDFAVEKRIAVSYKSSPLNMLNELEWIDGRIWANIYTTDYIAIINPESGVAEGIVDMRNLLPSTDRTEQTDVLNGIAYDAATKRIFVTGKRWNKLFEIEIIEK